MDKEDNPKEIALKIGETLTDLDVIKHILTVDSHLFFRDGMYDIKFRLENGMDINIFYDRFYEETYIRLYGSGRFVIDKSFKELFQKLKEFFIDIDECFDDDLALRLFDFYIFLCSYGQDNSNDYSLNPIYSCMIRRDLHTLSGVLTRYGYKQRVKKFLKEELANIIGI